MLSFEFLSTPSVWRATATGSMSLSSTSISIHALRVEGDHTLDSAPVIGGVFLSTPSVWRATKLYYRLLQQTRISIHALRVEGDAL